MSQLSAAAPSLVIPGAGEIHHNPAFMDPALVNSVNAVTRNSDTILMTGLVFQRKRPADVQSILNKETGFLQLPNELIAMTKFVIDAVPFEWRRVGLYIRHMGNLGMRSLTIHADNDPSMRVLVEGDESRWKFERSKYATQYPNGLPLTRGAAIVLNNYCAIADQLRHGVELNAGTAHRTSYLYNFYL